MATRVINTKHFKVSKLIREKIRFMLPGESLPTIQKLKQLYNVSQATITQSLDRLRDQGIIERPSGKKRLIVSGAQPDFRITLVRPLWSSPDYDGITNTIYELGHKENFNFDVYIYGKIDTLNIEHALRNSDAGFVIGDRNMTREQIASFNGSRKPIIFLRDKPKGLKAGSVWVNDFAVGKLATEHLLKLGHRKILVMLSEPSNPSSAMRMQGWRAAMQKKGVKNLENFVADCSVSPEVDAIQGSYERLKRWLESNDKFTAVFCVSWTGALAALRALRERGLSVPRDVSLITYASESSICDFLNPALTTVQTDINHYAHEAIKLIRDNLHNSRKIPVQNQISLKPYLCVRNSTAAP